MKTITIAKELLQTGDNSFLGSLNNREHDTPMFAARKEMTCLGKRSFAQKKNSEEKVSYDENTDDSSWLKIADSLCVKVNNTSHAVSSKMASTTTMSSTFDSINQFDVCKLQNLTPTNTLAKKINHDLWLSPEVSPNKRPKYDSKYPDSTWEPISRGESMPPKSESGPHITHENNQSLHNHK